LYKSAFLYYLFLSLLGAISLLFFGRKTIFKSIYKEVLFRGLFSLILIATVTALYFTRGRTVFIVAIPILIYWACYYKVSKSEENNIKYIRLDFIVLGALSILAYLFSYLYLKGDVISGFKIVSLDQSFYASLSDLMIFSKKESFNLISDPLNPSTKIVPYHYYENWLGIMSSKIFKINSVYSLYSVVMPTSVFLSILGFFIIIKPESGKKLFQVIFYTVISIFFIFITGVYFDVHINSIVFEGNFKFIYVLPFFVLLIVLILDSSVFSSIGFVILLIIPIVNIVFLPHIALLSSCLVLYNSYIKRSVKHLFKDKFILFVTLIYLALFTYYLFVLSKATDSHAAQIITSLGGIINNIIINISSFISSKLIVLIVLSLLLYFKKLNKELRQLFFISILFLLLGSLSGSILNTNQNAYQIFLSADIMVTFILIIIIIKSLQLLSNKANLLALSIIFVFSVYCFSRDFVDNGKVTLFEDTNKYDPSFLRKLSSFNFENKIGIKLVDAEQRIYTRRSPVYCGASAYFPYINNILYSIVVNPHTLLSPNDNQMININRNIEFINGSIFLKNNISEEFELDSVKYQEDIVAFIDKFKPEFCIVEGNASIPEYIIPFIKGESIIGSNEKIYILKYYQD